MARTATVAVALSALLLWSCDHQHESRLRSSRAAVAAQAAAVVDALPEPPCADEALLRRWKSASSSQRLCQLLPRVSADHFATSRMPSQGIPSSMRAAMREVVEKCREELRFTGRFMNFYSVNHFRVLITTSGSMILAMPLASNPGNPFQDCVLQGIVRTSSPQAEGDLLEVTVPPLGFRWWPDTQTPWLTRAQVW